MKRSPILIFLLVIGTMISAMLLFIQSPRFARVAKSVAAKYLPQDLGVEGDFSELSVKFFPPGISLLNPKLAVRAHNVAGLPAGSSVEAKRLDLNFRLFQAFTGNIRVHEVVVVDGDVRLALDRAALEKRPTKKSTPIDFHWDELLQIRAEAVALRNTRLHVELLGLPRGEKGRFEMLAKSVRVAQWAGTGGMGYELELEIEGAKAELPMLQLSSSKSFRIPAEIDRIRGSVHVNPLGLQLDELFVSASGIEVQATGTMKGNVLNPKALGFQGNVEGRASLEQVLEAFLPGSRADGRVEFKGRVHGTLDRLDETLRADGVVQGTGLRFGEWHADQLKLEGAWKAAPGGGELSLSQGLLASAERSRQPPSRGASGGKVEFGPVKVAFPLGSDQQPLSVPIHFERAHAHWLGAGALKQVFPLDFRVTGPLKLTYRPARPAARPAQGPAPRTPRPWELDVEVSRLSAIDFQLDNQRLGQSKPLRRVLKVPRILLDGLMKVDAAGIRPEGLTVELPRAGRGTADTESRQTRFKVNGKIDFSKGYDFQALGPVNLADLGEIAENPIRGEGTLALRVHGPSSRTYLDFDCDLANTQYLGLDLGSLKGRITWDDDPSHLIFNDVRLRKGDTSYRSDGLLDLGDANSVNLAFQIPQGDVQDLIQIFGVLTRDLWWFPRSLSGPASGSVQLTGGIATNALKIAGRLSGTDWEYAGERFQSVALAGGFDRGKYFVNDFRTLKRRGSFSGRISSGPDREFDWELRTHDLTVNDLDHVARLDVPIRGKLSISSTGRGREGTISSTTEMSLTSFAVRGVPMPASNATIRTQAGAAEVKASALGGQGTLDLEYDFKPGGRGMLKAEARQLDFSPVLLLLNPRAIQDRALAGLISGSAELRFRSGEEDRGSGKVEFSEYLLQKTGAVFKLLRPVAFKVNEGSFELQGAVIRGSQGEARLDLRSNRGALDGKVTGDIDIALVEFATSAIARSTGTAELDFSVGGTLRAPTLLGKATLADSSVQMSSLESPFENVAGVFQLRQNVIYVQDLEADLAGGRVEADGTVEVFATRVPQIKLKGTMAGSKLKVYPFQFVHVKSGTITLRGEEIPYFVEGSAVVDSALSKERVFNQRGQGEGLKAIQYMPPVGPQSKGGYPLFKLNIDVRADRGIMIQNDLFDAEARGQMTIVNTIEAPRVLGTAELLPGSHMLFKDRAFNIQSATANFDNPTVINPAFSLAASTEVNRIKINLFAAGRLAGSDQWKIELTSNPVLPQSELLSLLALGLTSSDSKRLSSSDRSLVEQGEAGSLLLHSLGFNKEVKDRTGLEVQLDEATNSQIGTSIFRPQDQSQSTTAPRIVIRRKIGSRMELSAKSTVGVGAGNQREVNAELSVTPGLSVIGVWDYRETVDAQKNTSTINGSYGLDLKIQKRFK